MIGNDIVDLQLAAEQSNWKRKRFLDKVFTESEQQLIIQTVDSNNMVWRLWSMKESAYKAYVRDHRHTFFNPLKLKCSIKNKTFGAVKVIGVSYQTRTISNQNFIYSVVSHQDLSSIDWIITNSSNASQILSRFKIKKNMEGLPFLYNDSNQKSVPISISHHGKYIAYSIAKS